MKDHLILNIQREFVNGSDIEESICKGVIQDEASKYQLKGYNQNMNRAGQNCKIIPSDKCGIYKLIIRRREKKTGRDYKKEYEIIFKDFCPSQMQNIIKENAEYGSILNYTMKLMDEISQSMYEPIWATYPYLPLI